MTSAEREARDRAYAAALEADDPFFGQSKETFEAGWDAARGATVAEIVEDLRETASTPEPNGVMANADLHYAADFIEARFSPAPPRDYNDTRPSDQGEQSEGDK